ncbi:hypothetical protein Belba_2584 [Belliella baltica DSM 15883]|uniref:Uncharacterized protein n=1 Tax=Belliella baltica (strain DSM 15883 / CIP 108006 / LMG 21964 / BA134) TaxID=866536 RepID=I3Z7B5_BELBD|nr:hypothetical protein [Belliella baltica]AFL85133.1 hypothetical protein Belba_2584 [Belliella baltica DSM 15883]
MKFSTYLFTKQSKLYPVILPMMRIGYVYELPKNKSYLLPNTTHEFLAVIPLFKKNIREDKKEVLIW